MPAGKKTIIPGIKTLSTCNVLAAVHAAVRIIDASNPRRCSSGSELKRGFGKIKLIGIKSNDIS